MGFLGDMICSIGIHSWGEWHYKKPKDCTKIRRCTRCSHPSGEEKVEHSPGDWMYAPEKDDCTKIRSCSRCQSVVYQKVEHTLAIGTMWRKQATARRPRTAPAAKSFLKAKWTMSWAIGTTRRKNPAAIFDSVPGVRMSRKECCMR
jgi:hypothetical protein